MTNLEEEKIVEFLKENGRAYPSDIAEVLKLDFNKVILVIKKLEKDGKVKEID